MKYKLLQRKITKNYLSVFFSEGILFRHIYAKFAFGQSTQSFIIRQKTERYFLKFWISGKISYTTKAILAKVLPGSPLTSRIKNFATITIVLSITS